MTIDQNEKDLWARLYKEGRVPLPELPLSVEAVIEMVENPSYSAGLDILMRVLAAEDGRKSQAAIERWIDSSDPEIADLAFRCAGSGVPIRPWGDRIMNRIAATAGHPRRYEAMIVLNALSLHRPLFESALTDKDPKIRCAAYSSLAIHGKPEHLIRLAKGLEDASSEVRAHVAEVLLESLQGSGIDQTDPLRERPAYRTCCTDLKEYLKRLVKTEEGKMKKNLENALSLLEDKKE